MTTEQKLARWQKRLDAAVENQKRQASHMGERLGAFEATRNAEREVNRIQRAILKLKDEGDK